jgi:glucose-6-phosphate 1-epimerase
MIMSYSDKSLFEQGKAIRGGIPIVWPQFGPGPLPQHGFARVKTWRVGKKNTNGDVSVELLLSNDEETLKVWPHKFNLTLTVRLSEQSFYQELTVTNQDDQTFEFTALFHTYFTVDDIKTTKLSGLNNVTYADKVDERKMKTENNEVIEFTGETDRVYIDGGKNNNPIRVNNHIQVIGSSTMPDIVVWNPWQEKAKGAVDIGEHNYPKYVCVEVGHVNDAVKLDKDQSWKGSQEITLLK